MKLVVALLLVVLCPGTSELMQDVVHTITGDATDHEDDGRACEHACTPLRHQCSCHPNMTAQVTPRYRSPAFSVAAIRTAMRAVAVADDLTPEPPPLRPPIA